MNENKMLVTTTGEIFQPVRIYYSVKNKEAVNKVFHKLKCIEYDKDSNRYVWLYLKEAKHINFKKKDLKIDYSSGIVIGAFFYEKEEMYLEVRSIERAIEGILFFDKYIKKYMAQVEDISIVNRLFSYTEGLLNYSYLFKDETKINPQEEMGELVKQFNGVSSINEALDRLSIDKLPSVERFPSHYNEDGILPIKLKLLARQHVAYEHWLGNENYTLYNHIVNTLAKAKI